MFTIRQYAKVDRHDVVKLWNECGLIVPWNDPHVDIEKKIKFQPNLFFIGELDGTLLATCMAGYEGHRGWINYLAVSPQWQRKGFGRLMMEHAENELVKLGCPKINLQIRAHNVEVIRFYESLGFKNDNVVSLGKRLDN